MSTKHQIKTLAFSIVFSLALIFNGVAFAFTGSGAGTAGDPYQITTCIELQEMNDELDAHYILMNDIDCSDTVNWNEDSSNPGTYFGFEPIGTYVNEFTGTLDGQGFVVHDLYIHRDSQDNVGLIGANSTGSSLTAIGVENASVTGSVDVGVLIGWNSGSIADVSTTGSADGDDSVGGIAGTNQEGTVTRSHTSVDVTADDNVGGLVGFTFGGSSITASFATGNVSENDDYQDGLSLGGLVGNNHGAISNSYATGEVNAGAAEQIGGLVGLNESDGVISNSYAIGAVTINGGSGTTAGGLLGENDGTIENSFWDIDTSGQTTSGAGEGKTTTEMKDILTFSAATWDIELSETNLNSVYPFLSWQAGDSSPVWYIYYDRDNDGVPNDIEDTAPNSGDANNDGTADSDQEHVVSFVNSITNKYAVLEVDEVCTIDTASVVTETSNTVADSGFDYPIGLMNFTVDCGTPGYTTTVTQYFYGANSDYVLRKHNPNTNAYFTVDGATVEQTTIDGQTLTQVSYQVTDGGDLDIDGTANGIIVDPVGLAQSAVGVPNTGYGGLAATLAEHEIAHR